MFNKTVNRLKWPVLFALVFVSTAVSFLLVGRWLEHKYLPVVSGFVVTYKDQTGGSLIIAGNMQKVRDCRFVEVAAYSGDTYLTLDFSDRHLRDHGKSRAEGHQAWGPWIITPNAPNVRLIARHQCHILWDSTTVLLEQK